MQNEHKASCNCYDCKHDHFGYRFQDDFEKEATGIMWNTEPKLANIITPWKDWWTANNWIQWHKLVKSKFGKDRANDVLIQWWEKAPFASPTTDFRTFDDAFIKYAKEEGFYDALFKGVGGLIGKTATLGNKTIKTGTQIVSSAGDLVENAGDSISFISKNLKWILLSVAVIAIGIVLVKLKDL